MPNDNDYEHKLITVAWHSRSERYICRDDYGTRIAVVDPWQYIGTDISSFLRFSIGGKCIFAISKDAARSVSPEFRPGVSMSLDLFETQICKKGVPEKPLAEIMTGPARAEFIIRTCEAAEPGSYSLDNIKDISWAEYLETHKIPMLVKFEGRVCDEPDENYRKTFVATAYCDRNCRKNERVYLGNGLEGRIIADPDTPWNVLADELALVETDDAPSQVPRDIRDAWGFIKDLDNAPEDPETAMLDIIRLSMKIFSAGLNQAVSLVATR